VKWTPVENRALEPDEEEEEILGSDDDEQEDPKDYVKGGYHPVYILCNLPFRPNVCGPNYYPLFLYKVSFQQKLSR
jgi:hypothetical protein